MKKQFLLAIALLTGLGAHAQTITTFLSGFTSPVGIARDSSGIIWIAEPGTGINDGRVFKIDHNKVSWLAIDNLPSHFDTTTNEVSGPWRAVPIGDDKIIVVIGGGPDINAGSLLTFDMSNFDNGEPPLTVGAAIHNIDVQSFMFSQGYTESNPYNFVTKDSDLYIADAGANAIVKFTDSSQALSIFTTFDSIPIELSGFPPSVDYVPTDIAVKDSVDFYVCNLSGAPFVSGLSNIDLINSSDSVSTYVNGLSFLVDMEQDTSGNLYVLQFGEFDSSGTPIDNSSKIYKITDGVATLLASGFGPSAGMMLDGDSGVYVTELLKGDILHISYLTTGIPVAQASQQSLVVSPNPFKGATNIQFSLDAPEEINLKVFSILGQEILSNDLGKLPSGQHQFLWNGNDHSGKEVSSGVYLITASNGKSAQTIRVVKN